jgi:polysaccharide biosynthesis protein PslH
MKLLYVSPLLPWPLESGSHQRCFHLVRALAAKHDVTVVTPPAHRDASRIQNESEFIARSGCTGVITPEPSDAADVAIGAWASLQRYIGSLLFSVYPPAVGQFVRPETVQTLAALRERQHFDRVIAGRLWMGEAALAAGFRDVIVDVDDVLSQMFVQSLKYSGWYPRRVLHELERIKIHRYERMLSRRYKKLFLCKKQDLQYFPRSGRERFAVVPNGVSTAPIGEHGSPEPRTVLFVGTLGYEPNVDAVAHFADEVLPRVRRAVPHARFVVAGRAYRREDLRASEVYGRLHRDPDSDVVESPVDLAPYYAAATVVVTPLRIGGGTRLKVLEALAHAKPLVTTRFAAEGIELVDGKEAVFADHPDAQAEAILALFSSRERRNAIGRAGYDRVRQAYDWNAIGADFERMCIT